MFNYDITMYELYSTCLYIYIDSIYAIMYYYYYYTSRNLFTTMYIVNCYVRASECNSFDCLMVMSPSSAQCCPMTL